MTEKTALRNFRRQNRSRSIRLPWVYGDLLVDSVRFHQYCIVRRSGAQTVDTVLRCLSEAADRYDRYDRFPQHARACRIAISEISSMFLSAGSPGAV